MKKRTEEVRLIWGMSAIIVRQLIKRALKPGSGRKCGRFCTIFHFIEQFIDISAFRELLDKVKNCAKAAALATGARLESSFYELSYDDLKTNETLSDAFTQKHIRMNGRRDLADIPHINRASSVRFFMNRIRIDAQLDHVLCKSV